jgi:hypothetical protein
MFTKKETSRAMKNLNPDDYVKPPPSWEGGTFEETVMCPEWVPVLDADEFDAENPVRSLYEWVNAVFPKSRFPEVHWIAQLRINLELDRDHAKGRPITARWECMVLWRALLLGLGYEVRADDWR